MGKSFPLRVPGDRRWVSRSPGTDKQLVNRGRESEEKKASRGGERESRRGKRETKWPWKRQQVHLRKRWTADAEKSGPTEKGKKIKYPGSRPEHVHICNYDSYITDEENKQGLHKLYRVISPKIQPSLPQRKKKEDKDNSPLHYVIWPSLGLYLIRNTSTRRVWIKYGCGKTHLSHMQADRIIPCPSLSSWAAAYT